MLYAVSYNYAKASHINAHTNCYVYIEAIETVPVRSKSTAC